jgi:hypothetical protein
MPTVVMESTMTDSERKSMPIRIDIEALDAAKIAASYKRMSVMAYVSAIILEAANRDIEESHAARIDPKAMQRRRKKTNE